VVEFLVARYGDFVLYRPPLKASTVALWAGPFVILALGAWVLVRRLRRRPAAEPELSEAERARAAKLLE
jgi:cytochrome c-type biogenesis protein CcmH